MFKKNLKKSKIRRFIDHLITGLAIVAFWRGVWGLLDIYLFPENLFFSYIISIVGGLLLLFLNDFSISEIAD